MSVITTVEAVPSRLRLIFEHFYEKNQVETTERLENLLSPPALRHGGDEGEGGGAATIFNNALREAYALGIVEESEGKVKFAAAPLAKGKKDIDEVFIDWIEPRLLEPNLSIEFRQENFAPALAWLLMQSPLQPLPFSETPVGIIHRQLGQGVEESLGLTNKERFQNLAYWARYLGYCSLINGRAVIADPTGALTRWLPRLLTKGSEVSIDNLIRDLALKVPVFDGGGVRQRIEEMSSDRPEVRRISQSTALALKRLEERGLVVLKDLSDAQNRIMDLGDRTQRVSHILLK